MPLQSDCLLALLPRALLWARSCRPFRPFFGYMRIIIKGNIRDYASINELICLANMENINAVLIDEGVPQGDRLVRLNQIAINQMRVLENDDNRNLLK